MATSTVNPAPKSEKKTSTIPITSVNERNSTVFSTHLFFSALDQYSSGHCLQLFESGKTVMFTIVIVIVILFIYLFCSYFIY